MVNSRPDTQTRPPIRGLYTAECWPRSIALRHCAGSGKGLRAAHHEVQFFLIKKLIINKLEEIVEDNHPLVIYAQLFALALLTR